MTNRIFGALLRLSLPLAGGTLVTACFVEPRPAEEIFDVAPITLERCRLGEPSTCHDGDACTRDTCVEGWELCLYEKDDSLIPDDGQECTADSCADGVARHEPVAAGTPCGAGGALQCDGQGACVGCGGDPLLCGQPTSCLGWACPAGACAPQPAPAGQALPLSEQVPNDCGVRQCDGRGGVESVRDDDPIPYEYDPCLQVDCFTGQTSARPAGSVCATQCAPSGPGFGAASASVCDDQGLCAPGEPVGCGLGYRCNAGACETECTPLTQSTACVAGATCVSGKCVLAQGSLGDCQASCATFSELGCPSDVSGPPCEEACLAIEHESPPACVELAQAYIECLGATAKTVATCAEHRTACAKEYILFATCTGIDIPAGPGCSPLPCAAGFDGCACAAYCDGAMLADHCVPGAGGAFTCTCAKDGVTVATCEGAAGCGIEAGCCKSAL